MKNLFCQRKAAAFRRGVLKMPVFGMMPLFPQHQVARRANHFGFSEIVSSPGIKNIPLSFSPKSAA
jgi:hypothetical protein